MSRLKEVYNNKIKQEMMTKFGYTNVNQVPKIEKIIVSSMTKDAVQNGKVAEALADQIGQITGQKAVVTRAKKSIASFKLREGQALGAMVTLRGRQMYEFLDRLVSFSLPRVKDFRGLKKGGFDGRGNFTMGVKEQIIFPEINYDRIDKIRGVGVVIVTTARNNEEGKELLKNFGMPFQK
jgi:large subunit ribosomal protein L5